MWYHLSETKWEKDEITELRQPRLSHGEPEGKRFCVAPSVGRAYLGSPFTKEGKSFFIYQVHVKKPVLTTSTADHDTVHEHIITDEVLASEGGCIPVSLVGQVLLRSGERTSMMLAITRWKLSMTYEEEQQVLWEVEGREWKYTNLAEHQAAKKLAALRGQQGHPVRILHGTSSGAGP